MSLTLLVRSDNQLKIASPKLDNSRNIRVTIKTKWAFIGCLIDLRYHITRLFGDESCCNISSLKSESESE